MAARLKDGLFTYLSYLLFYVLFMESKTSRQKLSFINKNKMQFQCHYIMIIYSTDDLLSFTFFVKNWGQIEKQYDQKWGSKYKLITLINLKLSVCMTRPVATVNTTRVLSYTHQWETQSNLPNDAHTKLVKSDWLKLHSKAFYTGNNWIWIFRASCRGTQNTIKVPYVPLFGSII